MKRVIVWIASACAMVFAATASAQEVVSQAGPFALPISSRTVERLSNVLRLDQDQKALAKTLYSGYRSSFRQAADAGDAAINKLNESMRNGEANVDYTSIAKERIRHTREFVTRIEGLESSFMQDLKSILTPEQEPLFERAERARRRETGLKFSFMAGEGVDMFQILSDLKIERDASAELKEAMEAYEVEVDRALVAKQKMLRGVFDQMEKFEGPEGDPKLIEKTLGEFFNSGAKLRDSHRQFVRKVMPLLPKDKQDGFDRAVKLAGFPRVYQKTPVERMIEAARGLSDLAPEQKSELDSVSEGYERELEAANARWAAAIEDKQSKLASNPMMMMGMMGPEEDGDPLKAAREARRALDERMLGRVNQILRPEQREKMPEAERQKDWDGHEYMPDFNEHEAWEEWKKEDESP